MKLTLAEQLAWKRFGRDLLLVTAPVVIGVLSDPAQLHQLGVPARIITLVTLVVLPIITALVKLNKEKARGN